MIILYTPIHSPSQLNMIANNGAIVRLLHPTGTGPKRFSVISSSEPGRLAIRETVVAQSRDTVHICVKGSNRWKIVSSVKAPSFIDTMSWSKDAFYASGANWSKRWSHAQGWTTNTKLPTTLDSWITGTLTREVLALVRGAISQYSLSKDTLQIRPGFQTDTGNRWEWSQLAITYKPIPAVAFICLNEVYKVSSDGVSKLSPVPSASSVMSVDFGATGDVVYSTVLVNRIPLLKKKVGNGPWTTVLQDFESCWVIN